MSATIEAAVRALAAACDGAIDLDGQGYNGTDAKFGNRLAELPPALWTPAMRREAWTMLRKYRHQLANAGIAYDAIPEPPVVQPQVQQDARQDARRKVQGVRRGDEGGGGLTIELDGMTFVVRSPYDPQMVAEMRGIPGRRWDARRKVNTVPASPYAARALATFAERHGFEYLNGARESMDKLLTPFEDAPPPPPPKPVPPGVTWEDGRFLVAFSYDRDANEEIKRIPGRFYDTERRVWLVPAELASGEPLKAFAERHALPVDPEAWGHLNHVAVEMKERLEASHAEEGDLGDLTQYGLPPELRPYGFQSGGVRYGRKAKRCFIADEMGLGKTIQALLLLLLEDAFPCVIVTPASVKLNWAREARKWLPGKKVMVVESRTSRSQIMYADVLIVNYDILKVRHTDPDNKRSPYLAERLVADLVDRELKALVADESHYLKSSGARRTKAVKLLAKAAHNSQEASKGLPIRLLLSGTPLVNRPNELISQLQILGRLEDLGGYSYFTKTYCNARRTRFGNDTSGANNLQNLNDRLRATCYVRRLKKNVLKDLPDKLPAAIVPLEIDNRAEYKAAEKDLIAWLMEKNPEKVDGALRAEQLVKLNALSQLAARGMMTAARRWINEFMESGEKLLAFAWHREIVKDIGGMLRAPMITGDTPIPERQRIAQSFTVDPENASVAVCNIQAGGTGLDGFQGSCNNVVFLELAWNPAAHDQATDRLHRIGQRDVVTPWYLIAAGTIYEDRWAIIEQKREVVNAVADGTAPQEESESMADAVIARLRRKGAGG